MGPLLFLLYIHDTGVQVETTKICLFADDALLYLIVDDEFGWDCPQHDLEALDRCSKKWQIRFNAEKCYVLSMCKRGAVLNRRYILNGQILQ